jgi:TonB-linked SusC/RagA family outer membrane protein
MNSVFLCLFFSQAWAQDRVITGKVTAFEDGSTLPGVNVQIKGTQTGTTTAVDGTYRITSPDNATLVFSFIGLTSQEVAVGNRTVIDLVMRADLKQLAEVVVTGVGVATDKRKLGISVEAISAKDLPQAPSASVDQALIGKIPGAQISATNGTPGADINILLRGINSLSRGTAPMILIDGIQVASTNLNTIDLNTIERVEVVQGAASATIYGAQGANGVIQLFTKKGKSGQLNVDISSSITQNTYLNIGGLRKAAFHNFATDADNNVIGASGNPLTLDPVTLTYSENIRYNALDPAGKAEKPYNRNLRYYDHYAFFFRPANTYNNSITLSGGKEKLDFIVSVSNNQQESNIINNGGFNRTNFTSNLGFELARGLKFRTTTQLAYTKNTIKSLDRNIIYSVNNARPFANFEQKDEDGNYGAYYGDAVGVNHYNPNFYQQYQSTLDNKVDVIQNFNLNYNFPKFVELDLKYGLNYQRREALYTYANQTLNVNAMETESYLSNFGNDQQGEIDNYTYNKTFQNFLASAIFRTDFANDFQLNIPIRTTTQLTFDWRNSRYSEYVSYGLGLPEFTPSNASQAGIYRIYRDYNEPFVTFGYLLNQRIEFGEIAGISGGFRSDYSSAFGGGSKPFTFPRGDAYFRLSSFDFWQDGGVASILPEMKLRAAYGEAGIQPLPFDRYVTFGTTTLGTQNAFYLTSPSKDPDLRRYNGGQNPDLNVEVSRELEFGVDLSFNVLKSSAWLNNINLSATYWKRSTDNAIYAVDVAPSSGLGTFLDNAFSLGSNGFQASLNTTIYRSSNFNWNFTANFGKQSSEITAVKGGREIVVISSAGSTNYVLKPGEKIGQLYGFKSLGQLDARKPDGSFEIPESERANYVVASNGYVVDKATKQPYFTQDQYSFGDPNPKFNMSFINDLSYKNFLTFSFQFDWVNGSHLYNQTKEWMYRDGIHSDYEKPFTINGETGAWTAFYRGVYAQRSFNGTKDYFYEDASFLRLRNVAIGLDLARVFKIKAFKKLQLVASGRNVLTFTKYTGMDPEISSGTTNSAFDRGTDHNTMPNFRSYQIGLNIGF